MKLFSVLIVFLSIPYSLSACAAHDKFYYKVHPKALQAAIAKCPDEPPQGVSCEELQQIGVKVNEYVYALRVNPQAYGKSILALQETIAKQAENPELKAQYDNNLQELRERLAIVGWLESPGGSS